MTFRTALYTTLAVLALHVVLTFSGAYWIVNHLDKPMHFLGGFAMGLLGLAIHHAVASRHHTKNSPWWYHALFVVGFAMLIGIAWEFHEYLLDNTFVVWYGWPASQLSLADTMGDFAMDFLGALVAFIVFRKQL